MQIDWDEAIRMDDGIVLRGDVYRPNALGRYPVILSYGPYGKNLSFQDGYPGQWQSMVSKHPDVAAGSTNRFQAWEVVDPEKWVPHGYVCVRVDSRGAGRSPGVLDCWSPRETEDLYECIEWVARQAWSNGKVGLNGISYYAMNQWLVAGLRPRHLAAICAWEGAADWYRDTTHHGGILSTFVARWYPEQVVSVQHGRGKRGPKSSFPLQSVTGDETLTDDELQANRVDLGAVVAAHPLVDEYHRERSAQWDQITIPFLSAANWGGQGLHTRGNFEAFVQAKSDEKYLECHGLEHWTHFYTDYGRELQLRFFNWYLKGEGDWKSRQPRVLLQIRHVGERFVEREESEWPLARTQWTRFYLDAADSAAPVLAASAPGSASQVTYDGVGDGVTFTTVPFPRETEVTGPVAARLFMSCERSDCDLFVVLRLFDPDGHEITFQGALDPHTPIAQGWLRASHRKVDETVSTEWRPYHPHDERAPLISGEVYSVDIELWPTSIVVPQGYSLALTIRGRDYEYTDAPHRSLGWFPITGCGPFVHDEPGDRPSELVKQRVTIYTGADHAAHLLLPIIP